VDDVVDDSADDLDRPLVVAHRGARRVAPENTLDAFRRALGMGADGVELDVRRTADGALVVHHDPYVPSGDLIATTTAAALHTAHPEVPTLAEALDACAGVLVNVEIKNSPLEPGFDREERAADAVVALLDARAGRDHVIVSSFQLPTIGRVRTCSASVATGLLTVTRADVRLLDRIVERGHHAIHPGRRAMSRRRAEQIVADAHDRGLQVNVWTVNAPVTLARLAAAGVDGLITDVPDVARRTLGLA
jgi:glycerophosphoryl diester phosphodiesterase